MSSEEWSGDSGSGSEEVSDDHFVSHGTSHMIANPDIIKARQKADPLRTAPSVSFEEHSQEGDEYSDEYSDYSDEYSDDDRGRRRRDRFGHRSRQMDGESFFEQRRREKRELLTRLNRYIQGEGGPEITRMIPNKAYNLETDFTELKEIVELCDSALADRTRMKSRKFGIRRLNQATCWLSGFLEHANAEYLDPESQFAIDGFRRSMEGVIDEGELDDVHAEIWEKYIKPRFSAVDNPFLQWGMVFGSTMVSHASANKEAYRKGELPDPRLERARLLEEQRKQEEEDIEEVEEPQPGEVHVQQQQPLATNPFGTPIEPGMANKLGNTARQRPRPAQPTPQYMLLDEDDAYDNESDRLGPPPPLPPYPQPPPPTSNPVAPPVQMGGEFDFSFD